MAVAITQTCNDCAYYSVRNGGWRAPVRPSDICQLSRRWVDICLCKNKRTGG